MILKYKVPEKYKNIYDNKKVIYCDVIRTQKAGDKKIYLVRMLNHKGRTNIFADDELEKISLIDKIKIKFL